MPKYLVGTDAKHYEADADVDLQVHFIVTAASPYEMPEFIEPYQPNEQGLRLARETMEWLKRLPSEGPLKVDLWSIWSTKTVVADIERNILQPPSSGASEESPRAVGRRIARRG